MTEGGLGRGEGGFGIILRERTVVGVRRGWMQVILSSPRGFCAGVVRAVEVVELCLKKFGAPVYVKHQIVHNPYVVASLENKGAVTVEEVDEIPEGSVVVFSAHGSPPEDFEQAESRRLTVIDATCPLVTRVHNEAAKYDREGRRILLVGHRGHQEVRGTMGQASMALVDNRDETELPDWDPDTPVAVLTQTTLSVDDTGEAVSDIQRQFKDVLIRNDICYATTNRQVAVKALAEQVDVVLVIGAENSSNCNRLREVAAAQGVPAYLINGAEELDLAEVRKFSRVGITSGASTPEVLVNAVIEKLEPDDVTSMSEIDENVTFVLPKELR